MLNLQSKDYGCKYKQNLRKKSIFSCAKKSADDIFKARAQQTLSNKITTTQHASSKSTRIKRLKKDFFLKSYMVW